MIKTYRKTATIKAEQFDGWMKTAQKYGIRIEPDKDLSGVAIDELVPRGKYYLSTLEGMLEIHQGDWIATGVDGEHWPVSDEIFKKTYAELPVIPKAVAEWIEKYKQDKSSIGDMLCSESRPEKVRDWMALTPSTYQFDYGRYRKYQELVARAWLDGYQIEEESK